MPWSGELLGGVQLKHMTNGHLITALRETIMTACQVKFCQKYPKNWLQRAHIFLQQFNYSESGQLFITAAKKKHESLQVTCSAWDISPLSVHLCFLPSLCCQAGGCKLAKDAGRPCKGSKHHAHILGIMQTLAARGIMWESAVIPESLPRIGKQQLQGPIPHSILTLAGRKHTQAWYVMDALPLAPPLLQHPTQQKAGHFLKTKQG